MCCDQIGQRGAAHVTGEVTVEDPVEDPVEVPVGVPVEVPVGVPGEVPDEVWSNQRVFLMRLTMVFLMRLTQEDQIGQRGAAHITGRSC
jgi:hypothetical protein